MVTKIEVFNQNIADWILATEVQPGNVAKLSNFMPSDKEIFLIECVSDNSRTTIAKIPDGRLLDMGDEIMILQEDADINFIARLREGDQPCELDLKLTPKDDGTKLRITHE